MAFPPTPRDVVSMPVQSGVGNMGSVTDRTSVGRFWLDEDIWVLSHYRATFGEAYGSSGASTTVSNTLQIVVDHRRRLSDPNGTEMAEFAFVYDEVLKVGFGGKVAINVRISDEDLRGFICYRGDVLVFTWTNPDTDGKQRWDLEVGLARV